MLFESFVEIKIVIEIENNNRQFLTKFYKPGLILKNVKSSFLLSDKSFLESVFQDGYFHTNFGICQTNIFLYFVWVDLLSI